MKKITFTLLAGVALCAGTVKAQWTQKAPMATARDGSISWTINGKFYVVGGNGKADLREYTPATNHWTVKANIPQGVTSFGMGFVINGKGYLCGGANSSGTYFGSLLEYDPAMDHWATKAPLPNNLKLATGFGFGVGNKGYIGCGDDGANTYADVYEYDPIGNSWSPKAQFGGAVRSFPYSFVIGDTAYVGGGESYNQAESGDLWKYDQANDAWLPRAAFPGPARQSAASFASTTKGYVALGQTHYTTPFNDVYQYDQASDTWDTIASFTPGARAWPVGFASGDSIYVCGGWNFGTVYYADMYATAVVTHTTSTGVGFKTNVALNSAVTIYPNPNSGEITVSVPSFSQEIVIGLYNGLGQLVKKQTALQLNNSMQLNDISPGIYNLKITDHGKLLQSLKIVRQ